MSGWRFDQDYLVNYLKEPWNDPLLSQCQFPKFSRETKAFPTGIECGKNHSIPASQQNLNSGSERAVIAQQPNEAINLDNETSSIEPMVVSKTAESPQCGSNQHFTAPTSNLPFSAAIPMNVANGENLLSFDPQDLYLQNFSHNNSNEMTHENYATQVFTSGVDNSATEITTATNTLGLPATDWQNLGINKSSEPSVVTAYVLNPEAEQPQDNLQTSKTKKKHLWEEDKNDKTKTSKEQQRIRKAQNDHNNREAKKANLVTLAAENANLKQQLANKDKEQQEKVKSLEEELAKKNTELVVTKAALEAMQRTSAQKSEDIARLKEAGKMCL